MNSDPNGGSADKPSETLRASAPAPVSDASHASPGEIPRQLLLGLVALACAVPLAYALFTDHIWEDSFITLRHSENLLDGKGLTFNPPELVHGFTSPINVLVLAACGFATGRSGFEATFWLYRVLCIIAFAGGMALLARRIWSATPNHRTACTVAFALLYIFDLKMVAFTANGMETAFMLFFFAGALSLLVEDDPTPWLARGLFWAGMMWTRPDGCVYIAGMILADLVFSPGVRGKLLISLFKSGLVCTVIYVPWIAWATWYYGSPVPHTVTAKAHVEVGVVGQLMQTLDTLFERFTSCAKSAFRPIYDVIGYFDGKHRVYLWALHSVSRFAGVFAGFYWLCPVKDRLGRAASLSFAVAMLYLSPMATPAPWYLAFAALPGLVALPRGIIALSDWALRQRGEEVVDNLHPIASAGLAILVGGQILMCGVNAWEMRIQQTEVEMGSRYEVGIWLREHGWPTETVLLEPLGYIGYFSKMHMLDWPGLVTPQMVALRKKIPDGMLSMIPELKPDWVVLRPVEYASLGSRREEFDKNYVAEQMFDATERLDQYTFVPGRPYVYMDAAFVIFRRRDLRPTNFPERIQREPTGQPAQTKAS